MGGGYLNLATALDNLIVPKLYIKMYIEKNISEIKIWGHTYSCF